MFASSPDSTALWVRAGSIFGVKDWRLTSICSLVPSCRLSLQYKSQVGWTIRFEDYAKVNAKCYHSWSNSRRTSVCWTQRYLERILPQLMYEPSWRTTWGSEVHVYALVFATHALGSFGSECGVGLVDEVERFNSRNTEGLYHWCHQCSQIDVFALSHNSHDYQFSTSANIHGFTCEDRQWLTCPIILSIFTDPSVSTMSNQEMNCG